MKNYTNDVRHWTKRVEKTGQAHVGEAFSHRKVHAVAHTSCSFATVDWGHVWRSGHTDRINGR